MKILKNFVKLLKKLMKIFEKYKQDIPKDLWNCLCKCSNEEKLNEYINNYEFNYNKYIKDNKEIYIHRNITDSDSMIDFLKFIFILILNKLPIKLTLYFDIIFEYSKNNDVEYKNEIFEFKSVIIDNSDNIDNINDMIDEDYDQYFQHLTIEKPIRFYSVIFCVNY